MLLSWWRRGVITIGFGPFPIIGSINLFLWFKPEWFSLQLAMVAVAFLAKEFIRWDKNGQRTHIFNPSAFPLAVASLALLATGTTDTLTWGYDVATLLDAPYMYFLIFFVSLAGQYFFGVTIMTMTAVATMYVFSVAYYYSTGAYFFPDTLIPIAVFLGMHLLFTDPSTSPRTDLGRVMFGALYAASVIVLFVILERPGMPSFYDKLLAVPILNLTIQGIDRAAQSRALRRLDPAAMLSDRGRRKNLAVMAVWCCGFIATSVVHVNMPEEDGTTALHEAVLRERLIDVRLLLLAGADPRAVDNYGTTPLSLAAMNDNGPMVTALVRAGADPNASLSNGLTMLMLAARSGPSAVRALLDAGASVNARNPGGGETALTWATRAENAESVALLVRAGAQ
jgi:hypothetical protein